MPWSQYLTTMSPLATASLTNHSSVLYKLTLPILKRSSSSSFSLYSSSLNCLPWTSTPSWCDLTSTSLLSLSFSGFFKKLRGQILVPHPPRSSQMSKTHLKNRGLAYGKTQTYQTWRPGLAQLPLSPARFPVVFDAWVHRRHFLPFCYWTFS